ncbi:serine protease 1-like [Culicoides brevitarsis]|uniref:serine protease 1-like n=1 Tax=Culicoides brevitarsis TaxID=469753 RepID=UPI00307BF920
MCLIATCVVSAKFNKQNTNVESESPTSEDTDMDEIESISDNLVSLRLKSLDNVKFGNGHFCSGSIIKPNAVLTVAHCVHGLKKNEIVVVKGSSELATKTSETKLYRVRKIFIHENYRNTTKVFDIALLELRLKDKVKRKTVALANKNTIKDLDKDEECQMSGWGAKKHSDHTETIKITSVKFVKSKTCNNTAPFTGKVQIGMFCAASQSKTMSVCTGDSGAALMCEDKVVGLVSWGLETCGKHNQPTVYTDVGFHYDWIKIKMAKIRPLCDIDDDDYDDGYNFGE